jgi:hypothetical protein
MFFKQGIYSAQSFFIRKRTKSDSTYLATFDLPGIADLPLSSGSCLGTAEL